MLSFSHQCLSVKLTESEKCDIFWNTQPDPNAFLLTDWIRKIEIFSEMPQPNPMVHNPGTKTFD